MQHPPVVALDPASGLVRGLRAFVLTVPTVALTATAHQLSAGCVEPLGLLFTGVLLWSAAVALLGSPRRLGAFLAWVVAAQVVGHVLLEALCADEPTTHPLGLRATTAHAVAAVLCAALACREDAGLWATRHLVAALGHLCLPQPQLPDLPCWIAPPSSSELPPSTVRLDTAPRRGPPALAA